MNREDVIRMAREAGCEIRNGHIYHQFSLDQMLARFAQAAYAAGAAAEREACAKVCEEHWEIDGTQTAKEFASVIRARGEK